MDLTCRLFQSWREEICSFFLGWHLCVLPAYLSASQLTIKADSRGRLQEILCNVHVGAHECAAVFAFIVPYDLFSR